MSDDRYPNANTPWSPSDRLRLLQQYYAMLGQLAVAFGRTPFALQVQLLRRLAVPEDVALATRLPTVDEATSIGRPATVSRWAKTLWVVLDHQLVGGFLAGLLVSGFTAVALTNW